MPSSRSSKAGGQGPLLKTWRHEGPSGNRAKAWLIARRAAATLFAAALVGWLAYLLFKPMLLPKTYFAILFADEYQAQAAPPLEFPYEDLAGFAELQRALTPPGPDRPSLLFGRIDDPAGVNKEFDELQEFNVGQADALIVFVAAHGVVHNSKAYLKCNNFDPAGTPDAVAEGYYPISDLLRRVGNLPGGTKLLLLDAGRDADSRHMQSEGDGFAQALNRALESKELPSSLWVISANSSGERSHVSHALRRSVFGYVAAAGLQGAADVDKDDKVGLQELARFVRFKVSE